MQDLRQFSKSYRIVFFLYIALCFSASCSTQSPEETLDEFYNYYEPDSESLDPLILAGKRVVPLVIERVQDRNMPRRRLAIEFLGNGAYTEALPTLSTILENTSEPENMRVTSLMAIFKIDETRGTQAARLYQEEAGDLGNVSKDILERKEYLQERRTYFDALMRRHD